jgi:citrate synthase
MFSTSLKRKMESKVDQKLKLFNSFKKEYGNEKVGEITAS